MSLMKCIGHVIYAIAGGTVLISCIFNFLVSSWMPCIMDGVDCNNKGFTSLSGMYSRFVAATCFVSCLIMLYKFSFSMKGYNNNVEAYSNYSPVTRKDRRSYLIFTWTVTVSLLTIILPINVLRLRIMYNNHTNTLVWIFFVVMYVENLFISVSELYFASKCWNLYLKFSSINADLKQLKDEVSNVFPLSTNVQLKKSYHPRWLHRQHRITSFINFYSPPKGQRQLATVVEILRIRHRLIREAVTNLTELFGLPMCLSLCSLCVMALFDIYYEVFNLLNYRSRSSIFIYGWLTQYSYRFYMIVMVADTMMKQILTCTTLRAERTKWVKFILMAVQV
ncbi:uncharacterized protein LOC126839397 [Adelges cooleyi]|uniref:uncharacterized protein LOC126839397 n=1 Tax=Adelges cooleyi TaxID=133065 RepID=UPI00217FC2D2|nr:uncharacterized protein LOC126839397 [Adelges cooleyi]